jgi:hypothetical protein
MKKINCPCDSPLYYIIFHEFGECYMFTDKFTCQTTELTEGNNINYNGDSVTYIAVTAWITRSFTE